MPKRLRHFLHHRPQTATAVLHILLRALQATLRQACPEAPADASFGAVSSLHRFGSSLNPRFHQDTIRSRVLRHFRRHGLLEPLDAEDRLSWDLAGGFSLDSSVRIEATDRAGLDRLIRYCARPPFALDRLHLVDGRSDPVLYLLPKPCRRTALRLSALQFLDRLAKSLPPSRLHRHGYHGLFAPNAPLKPLVTARAQEENALAASGPRSCSFLPSTYRGLAANVRDVRNPKNWTPSHPGRPNGPLFRHGSMKSST